MSRSTIIEQTKFSLLMINSYFLKETSCLETPLRPQIHNGSHDERSVDKVVGKNGRFLVHILCILKVLVLSLISLFAHAGPSILFKSLCSVLDADIYCPIKDKVYSKCLQSTELCP